MEEMYQMSRLPHTVLRVVDDNLSISMAILFHPCRMTCTQCKLLREVHLAEEACTEEEEVRRHEEVLMAVQEEEDTGQAQDQEEACAAHHQDGMATDVGAVCQAQVQVQVLWVEARPHLGTTTTTSTVRDHRHRVKPRPTVPLEHHLSPRSLPWQ